MKTSVSCQLGRRLLIIDKHSELSKSWKVLLQTTFKINVNSGNTVTLCDSFRFSNMLSIRLSQLDVTNSDKLLFFTETVQMFLWLQPSLFVQCYFTGRTTVWWGLKPHRPPSYTVQMSLFTHGHYWCHVGAAPLVSHTLLLLQCLLFTKPGNSPVLM